MSEALRVLSAGAAKALVEKVGRSFEQQGGLRIDPLFDAAGAIRAAFDATPAADVVILPELMLQALASGGRVARDAVAPLGSVATGVAVPDGAPHIRVDSVDALRAALLAATRIYCPDVERATAGIHCVRMLRAIGIYDDVAGRLRPYANGATAMAALAKDEAPRGAVGCTQVTEILYTAGVRLVGTLPEPYALSTTYVAAVSGTAGRPEAARRFLSLLTGASTQALRAASGFIAA